MNLQSHIKSTLGWCLSLGTKLFSVVPVTTLTVQVTTLASQILLLLAFFLPLKVIILLGSEKIPNYFPLALHALKKNHLIVMLSLAAAVCYVLYLLSELLIAYCCKRGARTLLARSAKLNLFENQNKVAVHAYSRFTRAMAAATFFALSGTVLLVIYPSLLAVVCSYVMIVALLCVGLYNKSAWARRQLQQHYAAILNALAAVGFLISFFCLVADFLYYPHQRIFHAVIAVLVMRQALQRLTSMIQDIISLRMQHRQINAMFFHSQPLLEQRQNNAELEALLSPSSRETWTLELLKTAVSGPVQNLQVHWHQIDAVDVYAFRLTFDSASGPQEFLAKLFGNNIASLAEQERLLLKHQPGLPTIEWLDAYKLQGIDCHLFNLNGHSKLTRRQIGDGVVAINRQLLSCEPAEELLHRFSRTRPYLEQRLDPALISPLRYVCTEPDEVSKVEQLLALLPEVVARLTQLPRQIVSLDITSEALLISSSKQFHLSHWSSWRVEAVGCNWPVGEKQALCVAVENIRAVRPSMAAVATEDVLLAAYMYSFERLLLRKDFPAAMKLLNAILECLGADQTLDVKQVSTQ